MVTRDMLVKEVQETFEQCLEILGKKNTDYAKTTDAFANFRLSEMVGVGPERANLVRVADKIARISNIMDKPATAVSDETVADTINDVINYMAILKSMLKHRDDK